MADRFPVNSYVWNLGVRAKVVGRTDLHVRGDNAGLVLMAADVRFAGDKWVANPDLCEAAE